MSDQRVPPLSAGDQFHAGIISDDPEGTMARLSESLGYQWGEVLGATIDVRLPGGDTTIESRCWYSTTSPRLEVVQSHPGTVWTQADAGLHHLGYWVDDVDATMTALQAQGYAFEAAGILPDGTPYWAYLHAPAAVGSIGPRLELVSRMLQPTLEQYFTTGKIAS